MRRSPAGLARDRRGVVAIEFALLAPFLVALLIGMFEVVSLVRVSLKLSHTANELSDIVAETQPTNNGQTPPNVTGGRTGTLGDACTGAAYSLAPYSSSPLSAQIVSLTSTSGGAPSKDWESDNACPTATTTAFSSSAIASATTYGLTPNAKDSAVVVKITYAYKPILHYVLGSSWTLTQTAFARPRAGTAITCSTGCT